MHNINNNAQSADVGRCGVVGVFLLDQLLRFIFGAYKPEKNKNQRNNYCIGFWWARACDIGMRDFNFNSNKCFSLIAMTF